MKLISLGTKTHLSFVEDYARVNEYDYYNIQKIGIPFKELEALLLSEEYDYVYIDLSVAIDGTEEQIIDFFRTIVSSIRSPEKLIIGAENYLPQSNLICELRKLNITKYVFSNLLIEQKSELEQCMNGSNLEPELITNMNETIKPTPSTDMMSVDDSPLPELINNRKYSTIGIVSECRRIGATTLAIQLCKYFATKGYRACYIESNSNQTVKDYIDYIEDGIYDEEINKITIGNVNMYAKRPGSQEVRGYDYLIYDYGTNVVDKSSFLDKDFKIGISGTSPSEMSFSEKLIDNYYNSNIYYCFNFTAERERNNILELMENSKDKTFFLDWCPDPFFLPASHTETFDKIFKVQEKDNDIISMKRNFFGRKK